MVEFQGAWGCTRVVTATLQKKSLWRQIGQNAVQNVYHSLMIKLTFSSFALTSLTAFGPPLTPLDFSVLYWQQVRFPGPSRPGGPWRPGDPLRPGGPTAPGGPWEPLYPCSPLGPMGPCIPLTPGEPGGPTGPAGPDCLVKLLIWHFQRKNGIIQLLPLHLKAVPLQHPEIPCALLLLLVDKEMSVFV